MSGLTSTTRLAVESQQKPQDAMGGGMLRPHVEGHVLALSALAGRFRRRHVSRKPST